VLELQQTRVAGEDANQKENDAQKNEDQWDSKQNPGDYVVP